MRRIFLYIHMYISAGIRHLKNRINLKNMALSTKDAQCNIGIAYFADVTFSHESYNPFVDV